MASIKIDTAPGGLREDFEGASTHMLPYDPVAKKRSTINDRKRGAAEISDTVGAEVSSFGAKEGIGKSGVHLRYHKPDEYQELTRDQKSELREWRMNSTQKSPKGRDKRPKHNRNKGMAAAVEKQVVTKLTAALKAHDDSTSEASDEQTRAYIMSLLKAPEKPVVAATTVKRVTLKSILGKAKNRS